MKHGYMTEDAHRVPITCAAFVDDGQTLRCARCGWWRTSHRVGRTRRVLRWLIAPRYSMAHVIGFAVGYWIAEAFV